MLAIFTTHCGKRPLPLWLGIVYECMNSQLFHYPAILDVVTMFKDAQQGVWDGVQEQILTRVLRKWGRRYKSDDEENLTDNAGQFNYCTSNSATLSRLFLSSTVHTFSSSLLTISTHFHCYLVRLLCRHYLSCRGAGWVSLTCWAHWLFFITTFICYKLHWLLF